MRRYKEGATLLLFISLFVGVLAGCSDKQSDETQNDKSEEQQSQTGVSTVEATTLADGEKIAKSSCIGCHGIDLKGDLGPSLHNLSLTEEQIIEVLVKGRKTMPPGTANGNEQAVAEYVLSLQ